MPAIHFSKVQHADAQAATHPDTTRFVVTSLFGWRAVRPYLYAPGRAVSQFRQLCEIADRDRSLTDTLKKVLKLSKGWETAREHVYKAVGTDNRMRCDSLPARPHPLTALRAWLHHPADMPCAGGVVSGRSLTGNCVYNE